MDHPLFPIRHWLDRLGIVLSGLCALHCLLGLVLVTLLGFGGGLFAEPSVHRIGLALAVVVGAVTLGLGLRRHGQRGPLVIGSFGIALMMGGLLADHGPNELVLTVAGVALIAFAHIRNLRHAN